MVKKIALFCFLFSNVVAFAQDSTSYELQRAKVNQLLANRSAKFGQYDESLNSKTGIFGLQTKKDIRNSNEILREIAITDNDIFTELKVLMDYKDLQVEQVKSTVNNNSERIENYRKTIKELQQQNEVLTKASDSADNKQGILIFLLSLSLIAVAILGYLFYRKRQTLKSYEKTSI